MTENALHIYFFELDQFSAKATTDGLSEAEKARYHAFKTQQLKNHFAICHQLKRTVLAKHLSTAPDQIQFESSDRGKPKIVSHNPETLQFNLSHTKRYMMLGVTPNDSIGVDIEETKKLDALAIAKRFYHPEEYSAVTASDDPIQTFYQVWVQKEAYLKASGMGISDGLDQFNVLSDPTTLLIDDLPFSGAFAAICCADLSKPIKLYFNQVTFGKTNGE